MTAIILLGPIAAGDGRPWRFFISIPLAIGNVMLCLWVIAWGERGYVQLVDRAQEDGIDASL
jgi:lipopolysaccharide export LptBFGC system permease protein LptF